MNQIFVSSMEVFRVNLALAEEAEKAANNNLPLQAVSPHHPALSPPCLTTDQLTGSGAMLPNQTYQLLAHHHPAASAHQQGCHPSHQGQGCQPNHQQGCQGRNSCCYILIFLLTRSLINYLLPYVCCII